MYVAVGGLLSAASANGVVTHIRSSHSFVAEKYCNFPFMFRKAITCIYTVRSGYEKAVVRLDVVLTAADSGKETRQAPVGESGNTSKSYG